MTVTPEASEQAPASESPVRQQLAAAAARAGTRATRPRKSTARKAAPRKAAAPGASRNDRAAARGKYANRVAPAVKSGAALLAWRNPVAGQVIMLQADAWAASLDRVAAEDPRVDAFLARVTGALGKSGAWGDFGKESALMVGGVMVATGRVPLEGPAGMVLALFAGGLVDHATQTVAYGLAEQEALAAGLFSDEGYVIPDERIAFFRDQLLEQRKAKAAAADVDDEDQGDFFSDAPAPARTSPFASWGR
jgi:hypothetical protein